jgi:hypothetical protein
MEVYMLPKTLIETEKLVPYKNGWYKGINNYPKDPKNNMGKYLKEDEETNLIYYTPILTAKRNYSEQTIDNYLTQIDKNLKMSARKN